MNACPTDHYPCSHCMSMGDRKSGVAHHPFELKECLPNGAQSMKYMPPMGMVQCIMELGRPIILIQNMTKCTRSTSYTIITIYTGSYFLSIHNVVKNSQPTQCKYNYITPITITFQAVKHSLTNQLSNTNGGTSLTQHSPQEPPNPVHLEWMSPLTIKVQVVIQSLPHQLSDTKESMTRINISLRKIDQK